MLCLFYLEELVKVQKELVDVRWIAKNDKAALHTSQGTVDHLHTIIEEKADTITV